jgi:hypothetical protein
MANAPAWEFHFTSQVPQDFFIMSKVLLKCVSPLIRSVVLADNDPDDPFFPASSY